MDLKTKELFKEIFRGIIRERGPKQAWGELSGAGVSDIFGDEAEQAQMEQDISLLFKLQGREGHLMKKIRQALHKLENDTYGLCEECGGEISLKRLLARPMADMCIECKESQEKVEGHIPYRRRSHTLGKEIKGNFNVNFEHDSEKELQDGSKDSLKKILDSQLEEMVG